MSMLENKDIKKMFDSIAKNYDKLNNIISLNLHSVVKKNAVKKVLDKYPSPAFQALVPCAEMLPSPSRDEGEESIVEPNFCSNEFGEGVKFLDVCTGTGDIAIYLAKSVTKNGRVIGVDFSSNMLEIAKNKAKNIKNLEFIEADALNLPFKDGEFDMCFISFGLRNLTDLKRGLSEMKRVTKSGGYVVNLDTGKPVGIVGFFYNLFFFHLVPCLGRIFNGDKWDFAPYKYLPESTKNFPSPDELVKDFEELGLKDVKKYEFLFGAISQQIGRV